MSLSSGEGYESLAPLFPRRSNGRWRASTRSSSGPRNAARSLRRSWATGKSGSRPDPGADPQPHLARDRGGGPFQEDPKRRPRRRRRGPHFRGLAQARPRRRPAAAFTETVPSEASATATSRTSTVWPSTCWAKGCRPNCPRSTSQRSRRRRRARASPKLGLPAGGGRRLPRRLANVAVKSWPASISPRSSPGCRSERKIPVLLLAHADESPFVEEVAAEVAAGGRGRPPGSARTASCRSSRRS
jgi:hypothetical protein